MTKDFIAIGAGMLIVGIGLWSLQHDRQTVRPAAMQDVRILADVPGLKRVSENSPYMRTER